MAILVQQSLDAKPGQSVDNHATFANSTNSGVISISISISKHISND